MKEQEKKIKVADVSQTEGGVLDLRNFKKEEARPIKKYFEAISFSAPEKEKNSVRNIARMQASAISDGIKKEKKEEPPATISVFSGAKEEKIGFDRNDVPDGIGKKEKKWRKTAVKIFLYFLALSVFSGLVYGILFIFPRVDVKVSVKKTGWNFVQTVSASKIADGVDSSSRLIAVEVFSDKKNISLSFPATARKNIERKASGEITIYNGYSSSPQTLIATTRFQSPDGKIFLLDKRVVVPGAKIDGGKIIPSSVKASITAEKAGKEYNIGPVERFVVPGFSGSPKYEGFYAALSDSMKGGFVGEIFYPTADDAAAAKEKTKEALRQSLEAFLLPQIGGDFKILDGGRKFSVIKETISEEADDKGNFSVFLEAEEKILVFKESDVLKLIVNSAKESLGADFEPKEYEINYGSGRFDFENGDIEIAIDYKGIFWRPISAEEFKNSVSGKKENDLKMAIFALPGVEKANVSFWPFWVKSAPKNANRIKFEIE